MTSLDTLARSAAEAVQESVADLTVSAAPAGCLVCLYACG